MTFLTPAMIACGFVFALIWLVVPGRSHWRLRGGSPLSVRPRLPPTSAVVGAVGLVATCLAIAGDAVELVVLAAVGGLATLVVLRLVRGWRLRRLRGLRTRGAIEVCDGLAAELRAGQPALHAIERALTVRSDWASVATAARLGGDVPAALRLAAEEPGSEPLKALAAAWEVAEHSGAALADVVERLAVGLRSDEDARAEVVAALGPPRATAKMLAALPLFGLGLGVSMGAHPVDFLLHTGVGIGCLGGGVLLALVGLWWVERIADAVQA